MIKLDCASRSTLAVCSCGWRHLSTSKAGAARAAAEHEAYAHPGTVQARKMAHKHGVTRRP